MTHYMRNKEICVCPSYNVLYKMKFIISPSYFSTWLCFRWLLIRQKLTGLEIILYSLCQVGFNVSVFSISFVISDTLYFFCSLHQSLTSRKYNKANRLLAIKWEYNDTAFKCNSLNTNQLKLNVNMNRSAKG